MIDFTAATAATIEPDSLKRVNYIPGLVLGADEFIQAHLYLNGKQRLHNRLLHGYGTISGLAIEAPPVGSADPEIVVRPGWAVDQLGREIGVPYAMCVKVNAWLTRHRAYLEQSGFAAGGTLRLCLVLCYKECETDTVPVPGEPCRSQNDVMQPSRIRDAFELRLCVDPRYQLTSPPGGDELCCCPLTQPEEDAARAFGDILERISITTDAVTYATPGDLFAEVRQLAPAAGTAGSPPSASPPGGPLYLQPGTASAMLREMFRVWVTEVRPRVLEKELTDPCQRTSPCLLLADVDLPVALTWVMGGAITVDESRRPYLLHTRLLQEWLLCGRLAGGGGELPAFTFASAFVTGPNTVRVWVHHAALVTIPTAAVRFSVDDSAPAAVASVVAVAGLNVFDVTLPGPPLAGNARVELRFDAVQMTENAGTPRPFTQVLDDPSFQFTDRFGSELRVCVFVPPPAVSGGPPSGPASGDLSGNYPGPQVSGLQSRAVASTAPATGNVLTWNGTAWAPAAPAASAFPAGAGDVLGSTYPNLSVVGLRGRSIAAAPAPADDDVLTYDLTTDAWVPRAPSGGSPSGAASGDLRGTYPSPTVDGIQGRPVLNAQPAQDQVLVWSDSSARWQPGDVVGSPAGGYAIVAGGVFVLGTSVRGTLQPFGPVAGGLRCTPLVNGIEFNLLFTTYDEPLNTSTFAYVVKGMVSANGGPSLQGASFTVRTFQGRRTGILIEVAAAGGRPLPRGSLMMVEISMIGRP